jgi:DNA repair exonuclease SbcCD ATPase subunit
MEPTEEQVAKEKSDESSQDPENPPNATAPTTSFPDKAVAGFLDNFKLELTHVSQEIHNLTNEQSSLLEKVGEHNGVIQNSPDLSQLMEEMKGGMDRLSKLRHEMNVVHERSEKLRSRAEKLEVVCKSAQKKEDDLVAKLEKGPSANEES